MSKLKVDTVVLDYSVKLRNDKRIDLPKDMGIRVLFYTIEQGYICEGYMIDEHTVRLWCKGLTQDLGYTS